MIGFDFETFPFGPCNLAPEPICLSLGEEDGTGVVIASCEAHFDDAIEFAWKQDEIVTANGAFDSSVIVAHRPKLAPLVWKAYRERRVVDILIREQLKVLADTGDLSFEMLPNGAKSPLLFNQAALEEKHLGISRGEEKDDEDGWRKNYSSLVGVPASEYPPDAYAYSRDDAVNSVRIARLQPVSKAEWVHVNANFGLYLNSCWGFPIDRAMVDKLFLELTEKFDEKNFQLLLKMGILRPSVAPRVMSTRVTQGKKSSINETLLRAHVEAVSKKFDIPIKLTDGGKVSFSEEVQVDLQGLDPAFDEFVERQEMKNLVNTELPRLKGHDRVHPKYRALKATGRSGSAGNKKTDKNPPYPAVHIQGINKRIREAYVADPGFVLCSIDYNFIELVSAGQKCLDLFNESKLADSINAGKDPHADLGSGLARKFDSEFKWSKDDEENYIQFLLLKTGDNAKYKHWRNLSKPTGLGLWGGLGAKRFVGYAKKEPFFVDLVKMTGSMDAAIEMGRTLKAGWLEKYPEAEAYFNWINRDCKDVEWSMADDERYVYQSPNGMVRRNCHFTDAANGAALQTPTAEGAKIALFSLAEALHDPTIGSCLLGCHQLAFIHDEGILQLPLDEFVHERAFEAARILKEGMSQVMTRVKVGAEPALMMRWDKRAETVFDENKRLTVWQPKVA